jgi:hypothetical protein
MFRRVVAAAIILAAVGVACGGNDDDEIVDPTQPPTATVPLTTPTAPPEGIRALDLQNSPPVQDLIEVTGGLYVQDNVLYADLTEDEEEEAVVALSSGGTLGDVGFVVLTLSEGEPEPLLTVAPEGTGGISVNITGAQLVTVEPVPGPDDPECCPSSLRTTTYVWDGTELVVESSTTEPDPAAGVKTPYAE